jgi:hypothetical protein
VDFLISGLATFINGVASLLPHWSFTHDISADVTLLTPYLQKANVIVPIDVALIIFGLVIGLELLLIALYWIDRIINLIRGAG